MTDVDTLTESEEGANVLIDALVCRILIECTRFIEYCLENGQIIFFIVDR